MDADAQAFNALLTSWPWKPEIHRMDGEILFEWIGRDSHAVVSIEGDSYFGYCLLQGGRFVSGEVGDPPVTFFPPDLAEYLRVNHT